MQRFYNATIIDSDRSKIPDFHNSKDLTGMVFGRLTVTGFAGRGKRSLIVWECRCECGVVCTAYGHVLRSGAKRSCGCAGSAVTSARSTTHGMTDSITYESWRSMRCRCEKTYDIGYPRYGGRGIKVCERWQSFVNFFADMGERPSKAYQIERSDNNGNYEPSNCRWATRKEQARNRRTQTALTYNGQTMCAAQWADICGIPQQQIRHRLRAGWSVERALSEPIHHRTKSERNRLITWNGESKTVNQWAASTGITTKAIYLRLRGGWSIEQTLTTPHRQRRSRSS